MKYLIVDGMLSGTGVRDAVEGGYVDLATLGLSVELTNDLNSWLARYENAHYSQFRNKDEVSELDNEGLDLSKRLRGELVDSKVEYFSNAMMQRIRID